MENLEFETQEKEVGFDREQYKSVVEEFVQDMPQEKKDQFKVKDVDSQEYLDDGEKMKAIDHNLACLFNYFDNKLVNKPSHEKLKDILNERMGKEKEHPLDWSYKNFRNANFSRVNFRNAKLNNTYFSGEHSDLRKTIFQNVNISNSTFERVNMMGVEFSNLKGVNRLLNTEFTGVVMNNAVFRDVDAENIKFKKSEKINNLNGSAFLDCNLVKWEIQDTDLNYSTWQNTNIKMAAFDNATLHKTKFDEHTHDELMTNTILTRGFKFDIEVA